MIHQLEPAQYALIRPLFQKLETNQPMCAAVLERIYPGKVYVDHPIQPRAALLTTYIESELNGTWGFLSGDPSIAAFNHALSEAIYNGTVVPEGAPVLMLTCHPDDWGGKMPEVLAPRQPIWLQRYHFISHRVHYDWRAALPQGFTVERMADDLRLLPGMHLPDDVAATLSKWRGMTNEQFVDFGFVTLDHSTAQPVIASWATVDFITHGIGDLGFFTQPEYRQRGLGSIAVAAALEHGFSNGLHRVNWTCDAENPGSYRTAEKLGLERIADYTMAVLIMDEQRHNAYLGQIS